MSLIHIAPSRRVLGTPPYVPPLPADAVALTAFNPSGVAGSRLHVGMVMFYEGEMSGAQAALIPLFINHVEVECYVKVRADMRHKDGSVRIAHVYWEGVTADVASAYVRKATANIEQRTAVPAIARRPAAFLWPDATRLCHSQGRGFAIRTKEEVQASGSFEINEFLTQYETVGATDRASYPAYQDARTAMYERATTCFEYACMVGNPAVADFALKSITDYTFLGRPDSLNYAAWQGGAGPEWVHCVRDYVVGYWCSGHDEWVDAISNGAYWFGVKCMYNGDGDYRDCTGDENTGNGDGRSLGRFLESMAIATLLFDIQYKDDSRAPGFWIRKAEFKTYIPRSMTCQKSDGRWGGRGYAVNADLSTNAGFTTGYVNTAYQPLRPLFASSPETIPVGDLPAIPAGAAMPSEANRRRVVVVFSSNGTLKRADAAAPVSNFNNDFTSYANFAEPTLLGGYTKYAKCIITAESGIAYDPAVDLLNASGIAVRWYGATTVQGSKPYMTGMTIRGMMLVYNLLDATVDAALRTTLLDALTASLTYSFANEWYAAAPKQVRYTTTACNKNDEGGDGSSGNNAPPGLNNFFLEPVALQKALTGNTTHDAWYDDLLAGTRLNFASFEPQPKQFDEAYSGLWRAHYEVPL